MYSGGALLVYNNALFQIKLGLCAESAASSDGSKDRAIPKNPQFLQHPSPLLLTSTFECFLNLEKVKESDEFEEVTFEAISENF